MLSIDAFTSSKISLAKNEVAHYVQYLEYIILAELLLVTVSKNDPRWAPDHACLPLIQKPAAWAQWQISSIAAISMMQLKQPRITAYFFLMCPVFPYGLNFIDYMKFYSNLKKIHWYVFEPLQ